MMLWARALVCAGAVFGVCGAGGCERVVDPVCDDYMACQAAFDDVAGGEATDTSIYAEEGDCWAGDPKVADRCAAECLEALTVLQEAAATQDLDIAACAVDATDGSVDSSADDGAGA